MSTKQVSIRISPEAHAYLAWLARLEDSSFSAAVENLLAAESQRRRKLDPNAPVLALGKKGAGG
jgi:hypothetical protein